MKNYLEITKNISSGLREWRATVPQSQQAFSQLTQTVMAEGALSAKTKELIALALGVAARCDGCLGFHTQALSKLGATREEVAETLAVAVQMGGGPSLMYAADAMTAFLQTQSPSA